MSDPFNFTPNVSEQARRINVSWWSTDTPAKAPSIPGPALVYTGMERAKLRHVA